MNFADNTTQAFASDAEQTGFHALAARALAMPLSLADRQRFCSQFNRLPAMALMGCALDLEHAGVVRVTLPEVQDQHRGGMGTSAINGAVISGLCDCALGVSGVLQFNGKRAGTVEMSIKFMRPGMGRTAVAYAAALKRGSNVVFAEAELYSDGVLCAIASGMVSTPSEGSEKAF